MLTYWSCLQGCNENPTMSVIQECWEYSKFQSKGFGWVTKTKAEDYRLENKHFNSPNAISNVPLWLFPKTEVDLNGLTLKRDWEECEKGHLASQYIKKQY